MKCRHCNAPWKWNRDYCPECKRNYGGATYPAKQTDEELRDIAERIHQIPAAFAELSLGGGLTIHQANLEDFYDDDEEKWLAAKGKDMESHRAKYRTGSWNLNPRL